MNVPDEYDDDAEHARTNMKVLGKHITIPQQVKSTMKTMIAKNNPLPRHHCRSVLGGEPSAGGSMGNTSDGTGGSMGKSSYVTRRLYSTRGKLAKLGRNKRMTHW
jgi:hypothetical protein